MIGIKSVITVTVVSLALASCGGGSVGSTTGSNPTPVASETYLNQVAVSGLTTNESVILQDNNANPITVSANQTVTFPASWQTTNTYAVTVASQTPGVTCGTSSASGTTGIADVTVTVSCSAGTESVLYSFSTGTDGASPNAGLITDANGNMYGTTSYGGSGRGAGTVFKLSTSGSETVLYRFGTNSTRDGANPQAGLIMDANGNLYGTTLYGGSNGRGTVFKLTPNGSGYSETVLYSFGATNPIGSTTDGANPQAGLIMDANGNLYGTTLYGGSNGKGTVFKLTPSGSETVLYSFGATNPIGSTTDGANPYASLIMDTYGNLYGTTLYGGNSNNGTVFKLTPNDSGYSETVLYSFGATNPIGSTTDGTYPYSSLIMDASGNLYGTTFDGGNNNKGTVFKLTPSGSETVLYSFGATNPIGSTTDGTNPYSSLIMDANGNLYGTTSGGGSKGNGTVFKLTPSGSETVLYNFGTSSATDGANPRAGLIMDANGNLYGTTYVGGTNNSGTIFKIN